LLRKIFLLQTICEFFNDLLKGPAYLVVRTANYKPKSGKVKETFGETKISWGIYRDDIDEF